jgi:photosystem II stability/assembly factor-like uncharacterized protein
VPWDGSATGDVVFTFANTKVYKSTNYGGSWSAVRKSSGLPSDIFIRNFGVAKTDVNVQGIAANGGRAFLSSDGGATWTAVAPIPNNGLSLSYIWFDSTNPQIVYVASVAPVADKAHLWKSTDFGASWSIIDTDAGFPTGVPVNVIKSDPGAPTVLYAGTHLGVYRSMDSGTTWTRFGAGLPLVEVTDVYLSRDSSLMRSSTFGRGFWELLP